MTEQELRGIVKQRYPHIRISIRTVSFSDLARCERKCLTITGDRAIEEVRAINEMAKAMGIIRDCNLRVYPRSDE